jgi:hypothetical protein
VCCCRNKVLQSSCTGGPEGVISENIGALNGNSRIKRPEESLIMPPRTGRGRQRTKKQRAVPHGEEDGRSRVTRAGSKRGRNGEGFEEGDDSLQVAVGFDGTIQEYCSSVRNQSTQRLQNSVNRGTPHSEESMQGIDLDVLLGSTKGAIQVNEEIWERISRVTVPNKGGDNGDRRELTTHVVYFPKVRLARHEDTVAFQAQAHYQICKHDLSVLLQLPAELGAIFPLETTGGGSFPDYEKYLERALLLHHDVLVPFLWKFKEFLEDVHISLGEIEKEVMDFREPCGQFLEDTFQISILERYWRDGCMFQDQTNGGQPFNTCLSCCGIIRREFGAVRGFPVNDKQNPCSREFHSPSSIYLRTYRRPGNFKRMVVDFDIRDEKGQQQLREFLSLMDSQLEQEYLAVQCMSGFYDEEDLDDEY